MQVVHVAIFPISVIRHIHNIWLSPIAAISQTVRKPRLVYDLSWSGLNKLAKAVAQKDSMRFGKALHRLLDCVLDAVPALGHTHLCKLYFTGAYMRICVQAEDVPSVASLIRN